MIFKIYSSKLPQNFALLDTSIEFEVPYSRPRFTDSNGDDSGLDWLGNTRMFFFENKVFVR